MPQCMFGMTTVKLSSTCLLTSHQDHLLSWFASRSQPKKSLIRVHSHPARLAELRNPAILREEGGSDAEQALPQKKREKRPVERLIALAGKRDRSAVEAILQCLEREESSV